MNVDFGRDAEAVVLSVQLDHRLAALVLADAHRRDIRPCDVIATVLDEHYARIDRRG
jgi:hypothetical protein